MLYTDVAQVTIYLPDKLANTAKQHARRAGKSVSAWITEILERETGSRRWPQSLIDVLTRGGSDLVEPDDPPPEDVADLR